MRKNKRKSKILGRSPKGFDTSEQGPFIKKYRYILAVIGVDWCRLIKKRILPMSYSP